MNIVWIAVLAAVSFPATASQDMDHSAPVRQGDQLIWSLPADHAGAVLNLVHPSGEVEILEFAPGALVALDLSVRADEGQYLYELSLQPRVSEVQRQRLQDARAQGEALDLGLRAERSSGAFRRSAGRWEGVELLPTSSFQAEDGESDRISNEQIAAQVLTGDVSINNSLCVGSSCGAGENFGFDTIRIKENNTRITFIDDSNSASFANGDWGLEANGSDNGDPNYFSIVWMGTGAAAFSPVSRPFRVDGGAPNNALRVDGDGDIGIGTPTPVVQLHVRDGNSPTLRLEQDNSSGFTPQTFDVAANETNFFVRDVTNGSRLPFKIKPGAPENSLFVSANGNIGLGVPDTGASARLDVRSGNVYVVDNVGLGTLTPEAQLHVATGDAVFDNRVGIGTSAPAVPLQVVGGVTGLEGDVGVGTSSPNARLHVTGGNVQVDGDTGLGTAAPLARLHVGNGNAIVEGSMAIGTPTPSNAALQVVGNVVELDAQVGIGTGTPQARLHVASGNARIDGSLAVGVDTPAGRLHVAGGDAVMEGNVGVGTTAPEARLHVAGGDLRVDGSVGVGTDSPQARLHVAGGDLRVDGAVYQLSSRSAKTDLTSMDAARLLNLLSELDLFNWRYTGSSDQGRHFGPTAEAFYELFGLGESDRHISVADMAGVALGAAQALQQELADKDREIEELEARLARLERLLDAPSVQP